MSHPCRVMFIEQAGAEAPLRERLRAREQLTVRSKRVDCESELRALARDFAPDLVISTDDLPAASGDVAALMRLLARQSADLLLCDVGDGNAVRCRPAAPARQLGPQLLAASASRADSSSFADGLPAFFERSPDAAVIVDADGWIGFANLSAGELLARYFPRPLGTYLAAAPKRARGSGADDTLGPNVVALRARQPQPVHGLVVFEDSTRLATRVHLEDLVRAKTARGREHAGSLPLVALELGGLRLLSENYGRPFCDELFSVLSSVAQPQYARCGLLASLGNGEHLVVLPHVSDAADAAVAVQGREARAQDSAMTDEFQLCGASANDPPVLRDVVHAQLHVPLRATPAG